MANPIAAADRILLQVAERLAKRVNWLTGKDNFWLARQMIFIHALMWVMFGLMYTKHPLVGVGVSCIIPLMLGPVLWGLINIAEQWRSDAMHKGALGFQQETCLQLSRFCSHFMYWCLVLPECVLDVRKNEHYVQGALVLLAMFCPIAICYLVSVCRPPFRRSMAWDWLKRKLAACVPQPTLQPERF